MLSTPTTQPQRPRRIPVRLIAGVVVALVVVAAAYLAWVTFAPGRRAVARVNGEAIARAEFVAEMERQAGRQVLQQMISQRIVQQEMKRQAVQVQESEIDSEMGRIKDQFPSVEAFESALQSYGVTEADLRREISMSLGVKALGRLGVSVSDDEVKRYFEDNEESLGQPEQVEVRHILVRTRDEANAVLEQIKGGASFAEIAKARSLDQASAVEGGDLGFISRGMTVSAFEETAFKMAKGEYGIAETPYGFHVIQVTDRKAAVPAQFEDVKDEIRDRLIEQKSKTPDQLLAELSAKATIEVVDGRYASLSHKPGEKTDETGANAPAESEPASPESPDAGSESQGQSSEQ